MNGRDSTVADGPESEPSVPVPIEDRMSRLASALGDASHLLCCLDFDGTLAPIVDDPDEAHLPPTTERTLRQLQADPGVTVAIVSGRSVRDLRRRIDPPVSLIGNHGLERYEPPREIDVTVAGDGTGGEREGGHAESPGHPMGSGEPTASQSVHPLAAAAIPRIETCCGVLETVLEPIPNAAVEHKRLTGTVHYRTVPDPAVPTCKRLTRGVLERIGGDRLSITEGNAIVEFGPAIDWGKGDAIALLREEHPPDTSVFVCGDDTTDEHAFRALDGDGIGVRVGAPRPSHSTYRTASPATLATLLEWIVDEGTSLLDGRSCR